MIEIVLPPIKWSSFSAPSPYRRRELVIDHWHATARWVKDLRAARTREARETVLEACPDDPRAQAMRRRIGGPWDLAEGRTWAQRIAGAWSAEAYETIDPPLGYAPNPGQCHGWIDTWEGLRGLVSIPLLRAVAHLGVPAYLDPVRGAIRAAARRPDGGARGYSVSIGVLDQFAVKPAGFGYFPELGAIARKDLGQG